MATDIHVYAQICSRRANGDTLFEEHELMQRGNTVDKFTRVCHVTLDQFNFQIDLERQMKQRLLHRCYHIIFGDSETRHHVTMDRHTTDLLMLRVAAESERMRRTKLYLHLRKIPVRIVLEVSFHRREQREMEADLRESMEVSDAFRAVPASQAAIDALEKTELHEVLDSGDDGCVICEDEISPDEEIRRMSCKHIFHHECIVQWLSVSNLCPLCRFSMPIRSGDCD
ncbi:hypothetical protein ACJRO7_007173 [Eucalyptus globulus]|uniref:RING-type E3 ubiquitin transferase n=1 Tax=Eucalyptus globulus TaxID=34317 RepID=A0ABD3INI3_EUCGL